ncbi:MAG TPA: D-amino acid dehydrogenase [Burkholderiaceae bacterium]|nr:D-amino acid dehydrogenase [Burkholderiaceae bacterium]
MQEPSKSMRAVVVGAGIIGVCTAHALRRAGLDVTVVERRSGVAQETSFANAGVMAPGYVGPWASPGMPRKVLNYLLRPEAPVVFRPSLSPALWRWLRRWLRECDMERYRRNRNRMQRLAFYSQQELRTLRTRHALEYEQATGYLQLFRTEQEIEASATTRAMLTELGVRHQLFTAEQCRALEPALHPATTLAGGLHLPDDETGNCAFFAHQLKDLAIRDGVEFRFGVEVQAADMALGRVESLRTSAGPIRADAYVIAGGIDSLRLLAPIGIRLPMLAVKGYSATAAITAFEHAPFTSVMDETYKVAITRMGNRLRVAGTAELGTPGLTLRDGPLRTLLKVAHDWFPYAAIYRQGKFWVGARPMLPDGPPVLGRTPIGNLFLNTGHGSTGWVMAVGSARIVADVIAGREPEIDLEGLTLDRYLTGAAA